MADFTVEGIIEVDASRAIRDITRFQGKLKSLMGDLTKVDRELKKLDGTQVNITVDMNTEQIKEVRAEVDKLRTIRSIKIAAEVNVVKAKSEFKALITDLRKMSGRSIKIKAEIDVKNLADDFKKQIVRMRGIRSIKLPVEVNGASARRQMYDLIKELKAMAKAANIKIKVHLDAAKAIVDAVKFRKELDAIIRNREKVKVDVDTSAFSKIGKALQGAGGIASAVGGIGILASAITAAVAAAGPLIAVLGAGSAGLFGAISVLGTGVGAFAALAIPTFKNVASAVKLLSTNTKFLSAAGLKKYMEQLTQLKKTNPTLYAAALGFIKLKNEYTKFAKKLQPVVLVGIYKGFNLIRAILKMIYPIAVQAGKGFNVLLTEANKGIKSDAWVKFFTYVRQNIKSFIVTWGTATGNFITGLANLVVAFDPFTKMFNGGLLSMSEHFKNWSAGLSKSKGFQDWVAYVKANWPKIKSALGQIISAAWNLVKALAPLGMQIITFIGNIVGMYNAFRQANPKMAHFLTNAAALVLILSPLATVFGPILSGLGMLVGALAPLGSLFGGAAVATEEVGGAAAVASAPIAGMAAAIAALVAIVGGVGIALALTQRKTKEFAGMMGSFKKLIGAAKDAFHSLVDTAKWVWKSLVDAGAAKDFQVTFKNIADIITKAMPILKLLGWVLGAFLVVAFLALGKALNSVTTVLAKIVDFVSWVVTKIVDFFTWLYNVLVGHSIVPDLINGIINWFKMLLSLPGMVFGFVTRTIGHFIHLAGQVIGHVGGMVGHVIGAFGHMVGGAIGWLSGLPGKAIGFFHSMASGLFQKVENIRSTIVTKFGAIVTGAQNKLGNIKDTILGFFAGAGDWLKNIGGDIIHGLIKGITGGLGKLGSALGSVGGFITSHKGPPAKDKVMLTPAGRMIMDSLIIGIDRGKAPLGQKLNQISNQIANTQFSAAANMRGGVGAPVVTGIGGVGGGGNSYSITIQAPVGSSSVDIGRTLVKYIDDYEQSGGRRKSKAK